MKSEFKELEKQYKLVDKARAYLEGVIGVSICDRCGLCCEINHIPFNYLEGRFAVEWLKKQKPTFQQYMLDISEKWLTRLEFDDEPKRKGMKEAPKEKARFLVEGGIGTALLTPEAKDRLHVEMEYLVHCTQCPFCAEHGCLVYPVRPFVCRTFGVARVAAGCKRPIGKYETESHLACLSSDSPIAIEIEQEIEEIKKINQEAGFAKETMFLPIILMLELNPYRFYKLLYDRDIPTAKLGQVKSRGIIWQEQIENILESEAEIGGAVNPMRGF